MLGSCIALPIPHERGLTPLYYGTVTDSESGKPIELVTVNVGAHASSKQPLHTETKTDSSGLYEIRLTERVRWFILIPGGDGYCGGSLLFVHPDYESSFFQSGQTRPSGSDGPCTNAKQQLDVSLRKKKR